MADPQTLFHLSDIHFGIEDNHALDWVKREVAEKRPDMVIITGDITMRARSHEFAAARKWIASLDAPVKVECGNHDLANYHLPVRYLRPFARFEAFQQSVQSTDELPGIAIVPLNTNVAAQPRFNWSKGWVTQRALDACLQQIDCIPAGTKVLVSAHHPLREAGTRGTALTHNGGRALDELAKRNVLAVLSGHVHDAFDLQERTQHGHVRMIGAGTLSHRIRSTPPGFNQLSWDGENLTVRARNLENLPNAEVMVDEVPEEAAPPVN